MISKSLVPMLVSLILTASGPLAAAPAAPAAAPRAHAAHLSLGQRLARSPVCQLLKGTLVDGPKEFVHAIKQHPIRTCCVLAGAVGLATLAGACGVPIDAIALCASAGLTAKSIVCNWPKVRQAFRRHTRARWEKAGEELVFPAAAFAAGMGLGAAAEEAADLAQTELGINSNAFNLGLKSTAQTVDDLVPITDCFNHRGAPGTKAPGGSRTP